MSTNKLLYGINKNKFNSNFKFKNYKSKIKLFCKKNNNNLYEYKILSPFNLDMIRNVN
jgi:dsRNA-specific ribonuclease